ncbi:MAG: N-(5'-phosphoribosyl)anthranilate isomerase [Flavobacteriaceae bacterium]|nr:MAG: N-(5'-phosphoribosyl)anthranilate isomerase [Flavobacteriaceae bacterium]
MKIKVCGMRDKENIESLIALKPDFIGLIFYDKSKRFVTDFPQVKFPSTIKKVGVFVNESIEKVIATVEKYKLDFVQLHGNETPNYCNEILNSHLERSRKIVSESYKLKIIKAFSVDENFDFSKTEQFEQCCEYFLFDTKEKEYGGNGIKFNWKILQNYKGEIPYFLSGGIGLEDKDELLLFLNRQESKHCYAVDVNSSFEIEPAIKDIEKLKKFKNNLV